MVLRISDKGMVWYGNNSSYDDIIPLRLTRVTHPPQASTRENPNLSRARPSLARAARRATGPSVAHWSAPRRAGELCSGGDRAKRL
eukprot:2780087-Pleurochrysis_carterae.AAC.1